MVNTQIIANELNNKLNTIANALNLGHQFKLMAHIAKSKQGNAIDGILKPVNSDALSKGGTDTGTVNSQIVYVAEVIVPTAIDNKSVMAVENAITKLVHDYNGYSFVNGSDNIIWELSMGTPKDYAMRGGTGLSMPMAFTVKVSYSDVGLINGIKAWTLDGETIPYTGEGVILDKEGVTLSVLEAKTQQTIPTSQRKQYKFTIPYDKTNVVCTTLQNDILNGDFRKTYTLAYNDGVVTYSARVSLFKTGDIGSQKTGDATMMAVSFVDAGNKTYKDVNNNDVTYTIGLLSFPFDDKSENTLYFESQAAQQTYMNNAVSTGSASYRDMTAPNLNTTILTNVVYDASQGVQTYDVNTLTNLNYAAIKKTTTIVTPASGSTPATTTTQNQYYYYWVTQCTQGADGILLLDLKLDTIQTYMFNPNISIPDCLIERAHLNRWEEMPNDATKIRFANRKDNPILLAEPNVGDSGKTCTARTNLAFSWTGISDVDRWLTANISYWVYAYVDTTNIDYIVDTYNSNAKISGADTVVGMKSIDGSEYKYPYGVFCYPVYRNNSKVIKFLRVSPGTNPVSKTLDITDFSNFLDRNGGTSHIFCIKASIVPPFGGGYYFAPYTTTNPDTNNMGNEIYIDGNGDLILEQSNANALGTNGYISLTDVNGNLCCRLTASSTMDTSIRLFTAPQQIIQSFNSYNANDFTTPIFNKTDIIGANHNAEYNPKMYQTDFVEYHLKDNAGYDYVYDKSKACTQYGIAQFLYSEALQPEITRYYCRYNSSESIYSYFMTEDYTGLAGSIDTTLSLAVDSYDNFIANNRNFWLQTLLGFGLNIAGSGIKSTNPVAGATSAGLSLFDSAFALSDRLFTKSNLEQAPDSIRNTSGSILGNLQIAPMAIFLETWSAYDTTSITADTYMNLNGYIYNQVDSVLGYLHTRKYFNYIKAQLTDIQGVALSNLIRNDIKQRFSNGLRFWDASTFATNGVQYDLENYELWLED